MHDMWQMQVQKLLSERNAPNETLTHYEGSALYRRCCNSLVSSQVLFQLLLCISLCVTAATHAETTAKSFHTERVWYTTEQYVVHVFLAGHALLTSYRCRYVMYKKGAGKNRKKIRPIDRKKSGK